MWITDIHYIATFLHPETKSLPTLTQGERNNIVELEKKMLKTVGIDENPTDVITVTGNDKTKKEETNGPNTLI
ncbi:unnamed protein product [Rotaria sp. Silwood2]|nr:unnamed protein product [Rotaria sp. Silwood2]CAF3109890.1 unnamed protein product [Rotaria sp. Silwood2]CAF3395024.1 unnamed protein product [Rotaria sp. Silwood2]CAF3401596.1 unnamed protein product [Rotaria sp. Silwood2]CAF4308477.1 unnamed protein product [Rotaria sp. Silwood2]